MAADWDTSGIHERRVDERMAPEPRRGWFGGLFGGRRRMAGVLTGVVSVAIIAAYIWSGSDSGEPELGGEPPLIQAEEGPVRVPPTEPGGLDIPHRDKLVLQRVPGAEEDPRRERLLPPPEEPLPPPREEPVAAYQPPAESTPPPPSPRETLTEGEAPAAARPSPGASGVRAPSGSEPAARPAAPAAPKPVVKTEPQQPARATPAPPTQAQASGGPRPLVPQAQQQPATPRAPASAGGTGSSSAVAGSGPASGTYVWPSDDGDPGPGRPSDPRGSASKSAPPRSGETTTAYALPPPSAQPAPSGTGAYLVQLAAVSSAEQAQAAWSRLRGNNGDLLAGLSPSYARTDLGARVVYRLRAGPVQGETRARALCAQLAGRNVDCMVVRAGG